MVGGEEKVAQSDRTATLAEAKSAETRDADERAKKLAALPASSKADADIVGELFGLGLEERTSTAVDMRLAVDAHDPLALAYRGALVALSASRASNLGEKMSHVAAAYRDLDAAVASMSNLDPSEKIAALLCRANVSSAVPNDVFMRAAQGAADFDAARLLAKGLGDAALENDCLAKAALAFEKAGRAEEAAARWATLAAKGNIDPRLKLELIDRGY
jgi:flagellar hook-length control protein FliK